jgi:hypothetical protein
MLNKQMNSCRSQTQEHGGIKHKHTNDLCKQMVLVEYTNSVERVCNFNRVMEDWPDQSNKQLDFRHRSLNSAANRLRCPRLLLFIQKSRSSPASSEPKRITRTRSPLSPAAHGTRLPLRYNPLLRHQSPALSTRRPRTSRFAQFITTVTRSNQLVSD